MSEVERRDGGAALRVIEGVGRATSSVEDEGYYCWECENTERFVRFIDPVFRKEEIDAQGRVLKDLGHVLDSAPDPEIRCGKCNQVLAE